MEGCVRIEVNIIEIYIEILHGLYFHQLGLILIELLITLEVINMYEKMRKFIQHSKILIRVIIPISLYFIIITNNA